jgi:hypothetical protein
MYEEGAPDLTFKDFNKSVFSFNNQSDQGLHTLDPTLENVIDLQELINNTLPALEVEGGPLTIDTIFPASDLDLVETHHTPSGNNTDISKFVPEPAQLVCMTHADEVLAPATGTGGRQIVTIKSEDLDLTACQGSRASRPTNFSRSADTYSESGSSRSSTPDKAPVVYECRKPGRKPSAGGPIRPRKKEPPKNTPEYYEKRARNNIAVRKSREKAKLRQGETESRVNDLVAENERLQRKVDLLTKELTVLKSLFINAGASIPDNFEDILSR